MKPHFYSQYERVHRLNLSKLNRSPLLCRLTTPSLKYLSSPVAVLPPIYHFSFPSTSLKPSLLLSLPLLLTYLPPLPPSCRSGAAAKGEVEWVLGEWRVDRAADVAPVFEEEIVSG